MIDNPFQGELIFQEDGQHFPIQVFENQQYRWLCFGSESIQSAMNKSDPHKLVLSYMQPMAGFLHFNRQPQHITLLGIGGGALIRYFCHHVPDIQITVVDHEPMLMDICRRYFELDITEQSNIHYQTIDAEQFTRQQTLNSDAMFIDLYDAQTMPEFLLTTEFYQSCYQNLAEHGMVVANILTNDNKQLLNILNPLRQVFDNKTLCIPLEHFDNLIAFAFKHQSSIRHFQSLVGESKVLQPEWNSEIGLYARGFNEAI